MAPRTLQTGIAVTVVLLVVGIFFILGVPFDTRVINQDTSQAAAVQSQVVVQEVSAGTGAPATAGDTITVHYTGRLQSGDTFDSSVGGEPYVFILGANQVIPGWEQGLVGVQAGTKRILVIPPALGYGSLDYGPIPANSTLIFEVEVLSVEQPR